MSESKKITLTSSDGENFEVDEAVARESEIIAHMIEDGCVGNTIPIANVTSEVLAKAIEYCKKHVEARAVGESEANLKKWDDEFMNGFDIKGGLFPLVLAANYLNVKGLIELICQKIADHIKDYTPEQVRTLFNIENDFSEEEEAQIRLDNKWAFEK